MALIPNRIVRISMAYKLATLIAFAIAGCCFYWNLHQAELLTETQRQLHEYEQTQTRLLDIVEFYQNQYETRCLDGSK